MFKLLIPVLIFLSCVAAGCASPAAGSGSAVQHTASERRVCISVSGRTAVLVLGSTPAADRLYSSLPLTLEFSDYNHTEKIAYLPEPVHKQLSPEGHAPSAGDLCIYGPWGNLCLFYRSYHTNKDLFYLGRIESGLEFLMEKEKFTAVMDRVK